MKRLLLTLLCVLFAYPCFAAEPIQLARMSPWVAGSGYLASSCADSSCSGFLVCQNFEGTGYDNSETWTEYLCGEGATCDEDYATSPLRGNQSYKFTPGTENLETYIDFTSQDEIFFHVKFSITSDSGATILSIGSGATVLYTIGYNAVNNKLVYNSATLGSTVLSTGTSYHLWGYYKKGTGSNEINQSWVSTTTTKSEVADYELTNGTSTGQASRISLKDSGNGSGSIFDQVLVKATEIGDVCD